MPISAESSPPSDSSTKNSTLLVANPARKSLGSFLDKDQSRIEQALEAMQKDPFSGDIKEGQLPG